MGYSTGHLANLFGVSRETVRKWAIEFEQYLSPGASPPKGQYRSFTDDDVRALALVSQSKDIGLTYEDVHASLKAGHRAEPKTDIAEVLPSSDRRHVVVLKKRINDLEQRLDETERRAERSDMKAEMLQEQLDDTRKEIQRLNREIGRLEVRDDDD